ncbi:MAG: RHS repeat-associated core domain-containing protein [Bacteroidales bacterium]
MIENLLLFFQSNDDYVAGAGFCCDDASPQLKSIPIGGDTYEKLQYYYHPDHLGSASYITNLDGEVVQHIEYVPFGEVFLEERNNTWNTPFLFNGKEYDSETGLYYYGARYYNPRASIFYGCDPLMENYPNWSPYHYCHNNPINLVDPSGMEATNYTTEEGKLITSTEDGTNQNITVSNERLDEFQQNVDATPQDRQNTIGWNNYWRDEFGGEIISTGDNNLLDLYHKYSNEEEAFANFMQNPSLSTYGKTLGARVLNQATSVESWSAAVVLSPRRGVAKTGVANSKAMGNAMEQALGMSRSKTAINIGSRIRFPDRLANGLLEESKNVKHLNFTGQLRDYLKYSQDNGFKMILHTRPSTTFSKPLQQLIDKGTVIHNKVRGF